jgi:uncharacterized protein YkwD
MAKRVKSLSLMLLRIAVFVLFLVSMMVVFPFINGMKGIVSEASAATLQMQSCKSENVSGGTKVSWTKQSGADSYRVYRAYYNTKTKKWSGYTGIKTVGKDTASLTITASGDKQNNGSLYRYAVRAISGGTYSSYKSSDMNRYLTVPTVKSAAKSGNYIQVTWSKNAAADGYVVYRRVGPTGGWTKIANLKGAGTLTYTDKKPAKNVEYYYTVRAFESSYNKTFFSYFQSPGKSAHIGTLPNKPLTEAQLKTMAKEVFTLINADRKKAGLAQLVWDETIYKAALIRAKEQPASYGHTRPNGSRFFTVFSQLGLPYQGGSGENVLYEHVQNLSATSVHSTFFNSSGHKDNLLKSTFKRGAVAFAPSSDKVEYYCVELFSV